jgi:outer membrane lipoprotein carrier protein
MVLLGAMSFTLHSQTTTLNDVEVKPASMQKQKALGSMADKASLREILSQFTNLKASFTQTIIDMQGQELQRAKGELLLQKPQKLRWSILSPDESLLIADGTAVYNVDPFLEQVTILDQAELTQSNPLMLLISNDQKQWDQVAVMQEGSDYTIVSLQVDSPITKLILKFNQENTLSSVISYDRQQQENTIILSNVRLNSTVDKKDFTFTLDEQWIVDDQRLSTYN